MRRAGRLAAEAMDMLTPYVTPGVVTDELDRLVREFTLDHGALPACIYYRGYAKNVCISPNHVVCHGLPSERALRDGDIVNIDVTVIVDGWHGDTSRMYLIGDAPPRARRLVEVTYEGAGAGVSRRSSPAPIWATSRLCGIQTYAEAQRCSGGARLLRARDRPGVPRTRRMCCTTAARAKASNSSPACSSPSSR